MLLIRAPLLATCPAALRAVSLSTLIARVGVVLSYSLSRWRKLIETGISLVITALVK